MGLPDPDSHWLSTPAHLRRFALQSAFFFLLATILFGWPLLFGGEALAGGDIVNSYLPYRDLIRSELQAGRFPHWNPYTFSGRPLQADIQNGLFYPPNLLFWIIPLEWAFTLTTLFHFWVGAWGMALWMRLRIRSFSAACLSGILFGFGGYATTRLIPGIVIFPSAMAWLPWLLFWWDSLFPPFSEDRPIPPPFALLGFVLTAAFEILAGAPQIAFYCFLALGIHVLIQAWRSRCDRDSVSSALPAAPIEIPGGGFLNLLPFRLDMALILTILMALAVGISCMQILPTASMIGESWDRAVGASWDYIVDGSFTPRMLMTFIAPYFFGNPTEEIQYWGSSAGYWEITSYVGALPILLFGFFLMIRWTTLRRHWLDDLDTDRRRDAIRFEIFLLSLIACSALLAFGRHSPFFWLAYHFIPGFDRFRVPGRLLLFLAFAIPALSGWTIDRLIHLGRYPITRDRLIKTHIVWSLSGALLLALLYHQTPAILRLFDMPFYAFSAIPLDPRAFIARSLENLARKDVGFFAVQWLIAAVLVTPLLAGKKTSLPGIASACMMILSLCALFPYVRAFMISEPRKSLKSHTYPETQRVEWLRQELAEGGRFLWLDSIMDYRFDQFQPELLTNRPLMHRLPQIRGYDPVNSRRYGLFVNAASGLPLETNPRGFLFAPDGLTNWKLMELLNVRTALSHSGLPPSDHLALAAQWTFPPEEGITSTLLAYRATRPPEPAWLAHPVYVEPQTEPERILQTLLNPEFQPRDMALVEGNPFAYLIFADDDSSPPVNQQERIQLLESAPGRYRFRVVATAPRILVLSEVYYPGWRAWVNEKLASVLPTNLALCGVGLPAGDHLVEIRFAGRGFGQGAIISLASLLLLCLLAFRWRSGDN